MGGSGILPLTVSEPINIFTFEGRYVVLDRHFTKLTALCKVLCPTISICESCKFISMLVSKRAQLTPSLGCTCFLQDT